MSELGVLLPGALTREDALAKGQPWLIRLICCGYDDGWWFAPTWEAADEIRESYCAAPDHERAAIVSRAKVTVDG